MPVLQEGERFPTVSVVVPTYNRADRIVQVCEPLLADPATTEVVVVVDGSTDDTMAILETLADVRPKLLPIAIRNSGVSGARAAGVDAATGDVVLFIDDDVVADPGLVTGHAEHHAIATDLVVVGYMPTRVPQPRSPGDAFTLLYAREYERRARVWESDAGSVLEHLWQGNVSVRRGHLERVGIREDRYAYAHNEDQIFGWKLRDYGLRGVFDRRLSSTHVYHTTVAGFRRTSRSWGAGRWLVDDSGAGEMVHYLGKWHLLELRPVQGALRLMSRPALARAVAYVMQMAGNRRWWGAEMLAAKVLRRIEIANGERLAARHGGWLPEWGEVRG